MHQAFFHWIEILYATQEHEIDCKQFQNYLPAFVEAELSQLPLPHTAVLKSHLQQCPDCHEIYHGLRLVVMAEAIEPFSSGAAEFSPIPTGDWLIKS